MNQITPPLTKTFKPRLNDMANSNNNTQHDPDTMFGARMAGAAVEKVMTQSGHKGKVVAIAVSAVVAAILSGMPITPAIIQWALRMAGIW